MNALTKTESHALQPARTQQFDLSPQTFEQALTFAKYLAESEMVPKGFRGRPGDCLIAMQWGFEVGLKALQALQSIAVINGKPGLYGDAGKAILLAAGCAIEEDDTEAVKKNGRGRCKITRPGRPPVERTFSVDDAKTAKLWGKDGPWTQYPYRQMAWRAFWFAARDSSSDLLRGLPGIEEVIDTPRDMGPAEVVGHDRIDIEPILAGVASIKTDDAAATFWKEHAPKFAKQQSDYQRLKDAVIARRLAIKDANTVENKPATDAPGEITFAVVMDKMLAAKNLDALYVAADWISAVDDSVQQDELTAKFEELQRTMEESQS